MAESGAGKECLECGQLAPRAISAPRIVSDYEGYQCPVTDKWIEGRAAHEENLKRTGSRILEPGEQAEASRRRQYDEQQFECSVEETAERAVTALPSEKREKLYNELTIGGLDATVTRSTPNVG